MRTHSVIVFLKENQPSPNLLFVKLFMSLLCAALTDRELPSPPINERPPPVPPHPSEEDQAGFPPPPSNDYVNYQMGGPRAPNPQHSHQNSR